MKTTWEISENSTGTLTAHVEVDAWHAAQEKAFNKLAKDTEVPGFRKGKAPKEMVRKQLSDQSILMEALNSSISDFYKEALDAQDLFPVAQPEIDIQSLTLDELILTFNVVTKPEVKLGDYKAVQVDMEEVSVSDDEITEKLESLQREFATMVVKDDGEAVEDGDTVVIDFEGFDEKGIAFEGGKGENFDLEIGSNSFIPGFEEQLIGFKVDDDKEIRVTFPEDYQALDLAGKPAVFKVKVHEIKKEVLPELNDEFAKDVDREDVDTLDQLKASIKDEIEHQKEHDAHHAADDAYIDEILASSEVEIPEVMIDDETDSMLEDFKQRIGQQGLTYDLYKQILNQTDEDVIEQIKPDAVKRVRMRLVFEAIADNEGFVVSEEEIDAEYENVAAMYGLEVKEVEKMASRDAIAYDVKIKKATDFLMDKHHEHIGIHTHDDEHDHDHE